MNGHGISGMRELPAHDEHEQKPKKRKTRPVMPYWMPMIL